MRRKSFIVQHLVSIVLGLWLGLAAGAPTVGAAEVDSQEGGGLCHLTWRMAPLAGAASDAHGSTAGHRDGFLSEARFQRPTAVAPQFLVLGPQPGHRTEYRLNLLVADTGNQVIRAIERMAVDDGSDRPPTLTAIGVRTLAGQPGVAGYADGPGSAALFNQPMGLVVDPETGTVYVADTWNHRIRQVDRDGQVTTVAGSGGATFANGPGWTAAFDTPMGLAVGDYRGQRTLFVADTGNHCLRAIDLEQADTPVYTLAGTCTQAGQRDGAADKALFSYPVRLDWWEGFLFVADEGNGAVRLLRTRGNEPEYTVSTILGHRSTEGDRELRPMGVFADREKNLYIIDGGSIGILPYQRRGEGDYNSPFIILAADESLGRTDECGLRSPLRGPMGVSTYFGVIAIADTENHLIRILQYHPPNAPEEFPLGGRDARCARCGPPPPDYR